MSLVPPDTLTRASAHTLTHLTKRGKPARVIVKNKQMVVQQPEIGSSTIMLNINSVDINNDYTGINTCVLATNFLCFSSLFMTLGGSEDS